MTRHYAVTAVREEGWWILRVPDLDGIVTQARRLEHADYMARDLIATWLDVDIDTVTVTVTPELEPELVEAIAEMTRLTREAADASAQASELRTDIAHTLREQGHNMRDIGTVLGVSYQRAHQLVS